MRVFAVVVALGALPGLEELLEDAVHFVADGHTAHDAGHEDEQEGHCCSGLFHVCSCHPHAAGLAGTATLWAARGRSLSVADRAGYGLTAAGLLFAAGYRAPPFRPPSV